VNILRQNHKKEKLKNGSGAVSTNKDIHGARDGLKDI
jgi:hypothetical protein